MTPADRLDRAIEAAHHAKPSMRGLAHYRLSRQFEDREHGDLYTADDPAAVRTQLPRDLWEMVRDLALERGLPEPLLEALDYTDRGVAVALLARLFGPGSDSPATDTAAEIRALIAESGGQDA